MTKSWDLVINFCDVLIYKPVPYCRVSGTENAKRMLNNPALFSEPQATMYVDWEDYETPMLGKTWWVALLKSIQALTPKEGETAVDVAICCDGGHGRTGTALTILGCLSGVIPLDYDPVKWVRDNYCPNAVETEGQIEFAERITDRPSTQVGTSPSFFGKDDDWTQYTWEKDEAGNWVRKDRPVVGMKSAEASASVFAQGGKDRLGQEKHYGYTEADFGYGDEDDDVIGTDEDGNIYKLVDGRVQVVDTVPPGKTVADTLVEWKQASVGKIVDKVVFTPAPELIGPGATSPLPKPETP